MNPSPRQKHRHERPGGLAEEAIGHAHEERANQPEHVVVSVPGGDRIRVEFVTYLGAGGTGPDMGRPLDNPVDAAAAAAVALDAYLDRMAAQMRAASKARSEGQGALRSPSMIQKRLALHAATVQRHLALYAATAPADAPALPDQVGTPAFRRAFQQALDMVQAEESVTEAMAQAPDVLGPGHAAQVALREQRWRAIEAQWGLWDAAEVAVYTGNKPDKARATVSNLRQRKALAGIKRGGALRYPGFQFVETLNGTVDVAPAWTQLRVLLEPGDWSEADALAWADSPNAWLDGRSPAQEIQEHPEALTADLERAVDHALHLDVV